MPASNRIGVDGVRNVVDQLDDQLGQLVGRRRLARKEERARRHLETRILPQPIIEDDDAQHVEELPLVFVYPLDVTIEDAVRVHGLSGGRPDPLRKGRLGRARGSTERVAKALVVGQGPESRQLGEVGDPAVADCLGDGVGEARVCQQQPTPRRDAVGLVVETLGKHLGQVLHRGRAQQRRMKCRHTVGAVRAHDRQVGHPNVLAAALLDQARAYHATVVAGEAGPDVIEQAAVDLEDDFQVARQQQLEPRQRPFLERLGQQRVVGVGQRPLGEVPRLIPSEARLVEQDAHQLGDGQRRVGIVELDGDLLGQRAPVVIGAPEPSDQIGERAGDEKVLLHEPQPLALGGRVIGVEHPSERLGRERLRQRADELAMAERLEIEVVGRGGLPEAQRVDRLAAIAHHWPIERPANQRGRPAHDRLELSLSDLERAIQGDLDRLVRPGNLPRVGAPEPVVGLLPLPTMVNGLAEHSVLVPEPVAHRRQLHRGHRVQKAGGQPAKPAVPEPGVGFLFQEAGPIEGPPLDGLTHQRTQQQIRDVVGQRATHQEFHREVVSALRVCPLVGLLGADPSLRENVPDRARECLVPLARLTCRGINDVVEQQVPLIQRISGTGELDRTAAVLPP